ARRGGDPQGGRGAAPDHAARGTEPVRRLHARAARRRNVRHADAPREGVMAAKQARGNPSLVRRPVTRVTGRSHETRRETSRETFEDAIAVERAMEIRVDGRALAVTLRTPGHDRELALGFLAGEGVITSGSGVAGVRET